MSLAAPFPYFGGKRRAAPIIWRALGDPGGYVEPFAGSAAVLLARPPFKGRRVETLNDADGWLVNCWRAIQHDPTTVAYIVMEVLGWQNLRDRYGIAHEVLTWLDTNRPNGLKGGHR